MRALLLLLLASCMHHWNVYDGQTLVLDVSSKPGAIRSTATLPPGATPATSAFMSATSHDAGRENDFYTWLTASHSVDEFLAHARSAGLRVVAE